MVSYMPQLVRAANLAMVLILIVVDNGLVLDYEDIYDNIDDYVLILIVVDNGLVHIRHTAMSARQIGS